MKHYSVCIHYPVKNTNYSTMSRIQFKPEDKDLAESLVECLKAGNVSCYLATAMNYGVDGEDLELSYADSGPWRSYQLTAYGDTLDDLYVDAVIEEVDQDGGTITSYGLDDAPMFVEHAARERLKALVG